MGNNVLRLNENGYELLKGRIEEVIKGEVLGGENDFYYLMGIRTAITLLLDESYGLYGMTDRQLNLMTEESRQALINQIKENIYGHEECK